jgi:hypothetical protein
MSDPQKITISKASAQFPDTQAQTPCRFWSDDFDLDLLKLWPNLPARLGPTAGIRVWTVGSTSYGRLNHPTVWNTHGAFLWLEKPNLQRDADGWFRMQGCVSNSEEIECTWLEWLRSWWPHHHGFLLEGNFFEASDDRYFESIMARVRGWRHQPEETQRAQAMAFARLVGMNHRFARLVETHRLGREDCPYFATRLPR